MTNNAEPGGAKKEPGQIQNWGDKINWKRRVKAVCKPCWEIKYCPYGPLIEDFPLKPERDEQSCRIYGHQCPVFSMAEPFTETKELRNISRNIPRTTQFRVMKRENQICSICGKPVKDEDIEFDHIIPWSKGGSSEEDNVRLLCKQCNRTKGNKFEEEYLVTSFNDHIAQPVSFEIVLIVLEDMKFGHEHFTQEKRYPSPQEISKYWGKETVDQADSICDLMIKDIDAFFNNPKPREMPQSTFKALHYRWGFFDRTVHSIEEVKAKFSVDSEKLLQAELAFLNRIGWRIELNATTRKRWLKS